MIGPKKQSSLPYREGSWFAVPLRSGGYGVGVIARLAPPILLAYLFGQRHNAVPGLHDVEGLQPVKAARKLRVGDLGLANGEWPIIGVSERWQRDNWPMPSFIRRDDLSKHVWRVTYDDTDPGEPVREESCEFDTTGLENDALYGYGAVELLMTKLIEMQGAD
jgi:hypothetical protein